MGLVTGPGIGIPATQCHHSDIITRMVVRITGRTKNVAQHDSHEAFCGPVLPKFDVVTAPEASMQGPFFETQHCHVPESFGLCKAQAHRHCLTRVVSYCGTAATTACVLSGHAVSVTLLAVVICAIECCSGKGSVFIGCCCGEGALIIARMPEANTAERCLVTFRTLPGGQSCRTLAREVHL